MRIVLDLQACQGSSKHRGIGRYSMALAQAMLRRGGEHDFRVVLNGTDVDSHLVLYAGVTPGFAGLFQINLQLPANAPSNPEIRIGYGAQLSPAGRILPLQ